MAQRQDPATAYGRMVPEFRSWLEHWRSQGYTGRQLVVRAALWAERPLSYSVVGSAAWQRYGAAYDAVVPSGYWDGPSSPPEGTGDGSGDGEDLEGLRAALAREREWGAAIQHDVIARSRVQVEAAIGELQAVAEWLRKHEG